jgi:hypothetical protein
MRASTALVALNRGIVSRLGLARADVKRVALACEIQDNFTPRVLGSMMLRPGTGHIGTMASNVTVRMLKFIFATDDTALIEMTSGVMRIWINDVLLTRPAVASAVTNGTFSGSLAGWTNNDQAGASSLWVAGDLMRLSGTGTSFAIEDQQVTVAAPDVGIEHALRVNILRGPVTFSVGSSLGADDFISETDLATGMHSLSFIPTGNFFIRFKSRLTRQVFVTSIAVEAAGIVILPTSYTSTALLNSLRYEQSGDTVWIACAGLQQRMIQRRGTRPQARSWSLVLYLPPDGPFNLLNFGVTTLASSALTGNVTLTASAPLFNTSMQQLLFSMTSSGQTVTKTGTANGDHTASIRVTGINNDRVFSIVITGDATASTVDLQRSFDDATWSNVGAPEQWTANVTTTLNDALNNQIVFYRLILTTRVAPDSVVMRLSIGSGSVRGIVRVTDITNSTTASAEVLVDLGSTDPTTDWQQGKWSNDAGWPTSVRLHEGRLWWSGINGVWGSISDAYDSFDENVIGGSGAINRTIGSGPVDTINWMMSLKGLVLGSQGAEYTARASSLDDPLTPTNFNVKASSTQGSGSVDSWKVDQGGYFVGRSTTKVFEILFNLQNYDYQSNNLMQLAPFIAQAGIVRMDVQRNPDTRIHCVLADGTALTAIVDKVEEVLCWVSVSTSGLIKDVVTLPALAGDLDDQHYWAVQRTINGNEVLYLEKVAQETQCLGGTVSKNADCHLVYQGAPTTVITGLGYLEGRQVVVWADGHDVGTVDTVRPWTQTYTVVGGQITLAVAASNVVVGLPYTAQLKSAKLGLLTDSATTLNQQKRINHLGLILADTHPKGLKFGPTLDDTGSLSMDDMPGIERGTSVGTSTRTDYDENRIEFGGTWTTDMRICLQAQAPRPVTVLAVSFEEEQN